MEPHVNDQRNFVVVLRTGALRRAVWTKRGGGGAT